MAYGYIYSPVPQAIHETGRTLRSIMSDMAESRVARSKERLQMAGLRYDIGRQQRAEAMERNKVAFERYMDMPDLVGNIVNNFPGLTDEQRQKFRNYRAIDLLIKQGEVSSPRKLLDTYKRVKEEKEAEKQAIRDLITGGKYTTESIEKYKGSKDIADLVRYEEPVKPKTKRITLYRRRKDGAIETKSVLVGENEEYIPEEGWTQKALTEGKKPEAFDVAEELEDLVFDKNGDPKRYSSTSLSALNERAKKAGQRIVEIVVGDIKTGLFDLDLDKPGTVIPLMVPENASPEDISWAARAELVNRYDYSEEDADKAPLKIGGREPAGLEQEEGAEKGTVSAFQDTYNNLRQKGYTPEQAQTAIRAAFRAGATPDEEGHWPSKFKAPDHPNRFVEGVDTITGENVEPSTEEKIPNIPTIDHLEKQLQAQEKPGPWKKGKPGRSIWTMLQEFGSQSQLPERQQFGEGPIEMALRQRNIEAGELHNRKELAWGLRKVMPWADDETIAGLIVSGQILGEEGAEATEEPISPKRKPSGSEYGVSSPYA